MAHMSLMMVLVMALGGGGDLLDTISTEQYWTLHRVEVSEQAMLDVLNNQPPPEAAVAEPQTPDFSHLLAQLGAEEYAVRQSAQQQLIAAGPDALEQVRPLINSPDPEVAFRARQIVDKLEPVLTWRCNRCGNTSTGRQAPQRCENCGNTRDFAAQGAPGGSPATRPAEMPKPQASPDIHRLMAIRTLGEMRAASPAARAALESLKASDAPFVAEYATRALQAAGGDGNFRAIAPPAMDAKAFRTDLELLPASVGVVGQARTAELTRLRAATAAGGWGGMPAEIMAQMVQVKDMTAGRVGNFRLDGVTLGVSSTIGDDVGYVILVLRGAWDHAKFTRALGEGELDRTDTETIDGVQVHLLDGGDAAIILDQAAGRAVFMVGPNRQNLPLAETAAAIKAGKGKFNENAALAAQAEPLRDLPVWMTMAVSDSYRVEELLAPFARMSLGGRVEDGKLMLSLSADTAEGQDAAPAVATFQGYLDMIRMGIGRGAEHAPQEAQQAIVDLQGALESVKIVPRAGGVDASAEVPISLLSLGWLFGMRF